MSEDQLKMFNGFGTTFYDRLCVHTDGCVDLFVLSCKLTYKYHYIKDVELFSYKHSEKFLYHPSKNNLMSYFLCPQIKESDIFFLDPKKKKKM